MLYVDFAEAWTRYRAAAPLMPPAPAAPVGGPRRVAGILEVADAFDVIVLDAYGVLHVGEGPLPGVGAALKGLIAAGKRLCVLTNDVTHDPQEVARRLVALGLPLGEATVVSGRSLLAEALAAAGATTTAPFAVLASHPEAVTARHPETRAGSYDPADLDAAAGLVLVDTNAWEDPQPERRLVASLRARPRPLIVCNPDITCPFRGRYSLEPGYVAFPLAADVPPGCVTFLGKPFPAIYRHLRARFPEVPPSRILAVGDSPHTDVLGARAAGLSALLVEGGLLAGENAPARCAEAGIQPDFLAPGL